MPILGEAGVGYVLPKGFDLPPLMFTEEEIEALVLGARIVESWGDPGLARAARGVLDKVEAVLPARLRDRVPDATLFAPGFHVRAAASAGLAILRGAVRDRRKVSFLYRDQGLATTTRTVRPLGLFYWGVTWSLGAWCELRDGFRNFRLDRMSEVAALADTFVPRPGQTLADLFHQYEQESRRGPAPDTKSKP